MTYRKPCERQANVGHTLNRTSYGSASAPQQLHPPARLVLSQSVRRRIGLGFPLEYGKAGRARAGHAREQAALGGAKCSEHVADLRRDSDRRRLQIVAAGQKPDRRYRRRTVRLADRRAEDSRDEQALRKTSAVETGRPGQTSTIGSAGQPSRGDISSPIPQARSARPARHIGTSAPSSQPDRSKLFGRELSIQAARSAREAPPPHRMSRRRGPRPPGCSSPRESRRRREPGSARRMPGGSPRRDRRSSPGACAANRPPTARVRPIRRSDLDAVADVGEHCDRVEQMVAVGAPARHMQREIDLRRGEPRLPRPPPPPPSRC